MEKIEDAYDIIKPIMEGIAKQFGANCEVVLHDYSKGLESSIVEIINGHVTGRVVGGPSTNVGFEVIKDISKLSNSYGYITKLKNGKTVRSSSIYLKNSKGEAIGSICINFDITPIQLMQSLWSSFQIDLGDSSIQKEYFVTDVESIIDILIQEYEDTIAKKIDEMNKQEKINLVRFLDRKGAFLIRNSTQKICGVLNISKFTLYSYLGEDYSAKKKE